MILIVDIGNSSTKLALSAGYRIQAEEKSELPDPALLIKLLEDHPEVERAIISSVRKDHQGLSDPILKRGIPLLILDHNTPVPVTIDYNTPDSLGKDRIAGVVGAHTIYPGSDVLVIDLGTAITIDFVDAEGNYRGGNISPGLRIRFRALNEFTDLLPLEKPSADFPETGKDTGEAIISGVQQGIVYELQGYIQAHQKKHPGLKTVLTGGDANFFANQLKNDIFVDQNLIFKGLERILDYNAP
jgi:type III pantothenate kinase